MIKFLFVVFMIMVVFPSVLCMVWYYFSEKKEAKQSKSKKHKPLTNAQMMALLEPDGKSVHKSAPVKVAEKKPVVQPIIVKQAPHEVQTITLKREIYY